MLLLFGELCKSKNYYQHKNFLRGQHEFSVPEPGIYIKPSKSQSIS